ncbi:chemotaxis protein CheW [Alteromonas sp. BMJM2]|uniref:chemotaxis protein CheW n=1 Tax=Alteromonas sp. BMJM2 TaxID=2954241 RepID=UPI0022B4AA11|nr:chemotaxis protein CheW [Alteromonas sp. BMJM2]
MSKQSPFAREDVMEAYLDGLLKEPVEVDDATARAAKLLEQASHHIAEERLVKDTVPLPQDNDVIEAVTLKSQHDAVEHGITKQSGLGECSSVKDNRQLAEHEDVVKSLVETPSVISSDELKIRDSAAAETSGDEETISAKTKVALQDSLDFRFQALFFEVAGLTLAVPLTTLGGIHQIDKISPLFGKPDWFMGVMLHRESKLSVVDSAKWVMPEKYTEELAESLNYRYLIMLGESEWGLASEKLVNTVNLTKDDVKWRGSTGKRPWLAGMVKEKMCALIDVEELISMLNKGLGSNDQTP